MICQLKQRYYQLEIYIIICQIKKVHDELAIADVEKVAHVSSYPILEYIGFDTGISDEVAKMRAATLLGDIFHIHKCTKKSLKYLHKDSKYGNLVAMPDSATQGFFSIASRYKVWVGKMLLHL